MTETSKEDKVILEKVLYIHYLLFFQKDTTEFKALINSNSKINAMTQMYASKLGLKIWSIDVGAQKIDGSIFETFGIVLASFQVKDKLRRVRIFQKSFLLADISVRVVLGMPLLTFSNMDIQFIEKKVT